MAARTKFNTLPPQDESRLAADSQPETGPKSTANGSSPETPTVERRPASAKRGYNPGKSWQQARELREADRIIEAKAIGYNKGGLLILWHGLQGFVPASQLLDIPHLHLEDERLQQLQARQGEQLRLKVIEVDEHANRLIFSERATDVPAQKRERLLHSIQPGEKRTGVVTNLADFGAFVDLGGVEGLIHISQLSWRRLMHPSDVVEPGQEVEVLVLEVDADEGRVALSRKQLHPDPWIAVEKRYRPGQIVEGTISNVVDFGAFTLVEEGLEGLIHVSEMAEEGKRPADVFHKGDVVHARVLSVSEAKRRLALSLRGV